MSALSFKASIPGIYQSENEDRVVYEPRVGMYAVLDGLGGRRSRIMAAEAASVAFRSFCEEIGGRARSRDELEQRARALIDRMRAEIRSKTNPKNVVYAGTDYGSSVAVLALSDTDALVAHAGDVRAYRSTTDGVERLTRDHTMLEKLRRSGRMGEGSPLTKVAAQLEAAVYRLGWDEMLVDIRIEERAHEDAWLLCTRGLWASIASEQALHDVLRAHALLEDPCEALLALAPRPEEDATVLVVRAQR